MMFKCLQMVSVVSVDLSICSHQLILHQIKNIDFICIFLKINDFYRHLF